MAVTRPFTLADVTRALRTLREVRRKFIGLVTAVVTIVIPLILVEPFLVAQATDAVVGKPGHRGLMTIVGIAAAYYLIRLVVELSLNWIALRLAFRVHVRLLRDTLENFLNKNVALVKSLPRGDVLYCLFNDTMRVASFASSDVIGFTSNIVLLAGCAGLMIHFDPRLALVSTIFLVSVSVIHVRLARVLFKKQLAAKEIDQDLSGRAQNMLSGITTLKVFRLVEPVVGKWIDRYGPRWAIEISIRMIEITLGSIAIHAHIIFTFVILFLGLSRATSLTSSLGQVFAFLVVYNRLAQPFSFFVAFYLNFQETKASLTRHYRMYDLGMAPSDDRPTDAAQAPDDEGRSPLRFLETSDAATRRGEQEVPIPDLRVAAGRAYLLEGPNGVGKSTTGLVLSGLLPLSRGLYRRDGSERDRPHLSSRIIYLEKDGYWPEGTIAENCRLSDPSKELEEPHLRRCLEICRCDNLVASLPLGIHNPIASDWKLLSDGESQRLFVAFAVYNRPDVLILDEALSNVPFDERQEILGNIRREHPDSIIILISHDPQDRGVVDQVIRLERKAGREGRSSGSGRVDVGRGRESPE